MTIIIIIIPPAHTKDTSGLRQILLSVYLQA